MESRELLSSFHGHGHGHQPKPHQAGHVHRSEVQAPPHQTKQSGHTGTLIAGDLVDTINGGPNLNATATMGGSGSLMIGRTRYTVGFGFSPADGKLAISTVDGEILADTQILEDGSGGNYKVTSATGQFAGVHGTGIFLVHGGTVSLNPHQ